MAGRGEYQKQLAALVAAAETNDMKFEDILPNDLRAHFQEIVELKTARGYIKQLEDREEELQAAKQTMMKELNKKQMKIDNLPVEYRAVQVDLQQAQRQVVLHKEMSEHLSERVERYRQQLNDIVDKSNANASAAKKIDDLQAQVEDQQAVINKLIYDNRKSEAMFEQLRESDTKALERKDKQLAMKDKELAEKNDLLLELRQQVQKATNIGTALDNPDSPLTDDNADTKTLVDTLPDDSLALREQNINLLQDNLSLSEDNEALKDRHDVVKAKLSKMVTSYEYVASEDRKAQVFAGAISEIKTLNRFYKASFQVLDAFANALNAAMSDNPPPVCITAQLDVTQEALAGYNSVKKVVRAVTDGSGNDMDQIALCKELDSLATSAADWMSSLEVLNTGLWRFLHRLSDGPKMLADLNAVTNVEIERYVECYFGLSPFPVD